MPPLFSFTIRVRVLRILPCVSLGIPFNLPNKPSLTKSCKDFPNMFVSQMPEGLSSNLLIIKLIKSSPCYSVPTIGETSVETSTFIMCKLGADAFNFTPYFPPCFTRTGSSKFISSRVGITTP